MMKKLDLEAFKALEAITSGYELKRLSPSTLVVDISSPALRGYVTGVRGTSKGAIGRNIYVCRIGTGQAHFGQSIFEAVTAALERVAK